MHLATWLFFLRKTYPSNQDRPQDEECACALWNGKFYMRWSFYANDRLIQPDTLLGTSYMMKQQCLSQTTVFESNNSVWVTLNLPRMQQTCIMRVILIAQKYIWYKDKTFVAFLFCSCVVNHQNCAMEDIHRPYYLYSRSYILILDIF